MDQLVTILQTRFSPHLALQHVKEAFPDMYSFNVLEINSNESNYKYNLLICSYFRPYIITSC